MNTVTEFLVPYLISNVVAIGMAVSGWFKPRFARLAMVVVFALAALVNVQVVMQEPAAYLQYGSMTPVSFYADFINGWFASHIRPMVLGIAAGQATVAALLVAPQPWRTLGAAGALVFLLAIAPLGTGSAFPCSLILSVAIVFSLRRGEGPASARRSPDASVAARIHQ